jgi:hypothetical protein
MAATRTEMPNMTPMRAIRRFDVFAEYTRQERLKKGFPEDEAKGYGIWLAKVVAARRFGKKSDADGAQHRQAKAGERDEEPKFRSVGDELQTDQTFDHDVIDRMGEEFYELVFAPAIADAMAAGKQYEEIRDDIRKDWKTARSGPKRKPAG